MEGVIEGHKYEQVPSVYSIHGTLHEKCPGIQWMSKFQGWLKISFWANETF